MLNAKNRTTAPYSIQNWQNTGKKPPPPAEGRVGGDDSERVTVVFANMSATVLDLGEWEMDQLLSDNEHIACLDWYMKRGGYRRSDLSSRSSGTFLSKADWPQDLSSKDRRETRPGRIAFRRSLAILPILSSHKAERILNLPHRPNASLRSKDVAVASTVSKFCKLAGADTLALIDRPFTSMIEPGRKYGRLLVARGDMALRTPKFIRGEFPQIWYQWLPQKYRRIVLDNPDICGDPDTYPRP